ncbi:MAG: M1 family metallopeptidase [Cyclobacteriaceae bacterium]|nr:M1 family metallopeptidase [Cyclobacteriaceae bacterium]
MKRTLIYLLIFLSFSVSAQPTRWQQHVDYTININLDVTNNLFEGTQKLVYTNNSPDTLKRVFYHLYFNAFQPGSMMDERSRSIEDPDRRVGARISKLGEDEIGQLYPTSLSQNDQEVTFKVVGTILEVSLAEPILPDAQTTFEMNFKGQVPVQIRRSGRDNSEGIEYSMSQWYPKICEYDFQGWHADPYVGREFYGVWGNFDVTININALYIVAATGVLQNPNEIGYGYEESGTEVKKHKKKETLSWHFKAENVHDFVWTADPDYVHKTIQVPNGPKMHFFYQEDSITRESWPQLIAIAPKMVSFMNQRFGQYPYSDYSVIQGGDGGMEYPMAALILGRGPFKGLLSVTIHEMFHNWYYGVLGSNETQYPWMDEGFTTYAGNITKAYLNGSESDPQSGSYGAYNYLVKSGKQEPLTTFADYYHTNVAYGVAAYSMGSMVPAMLEYIVGERTFEKAFRTYFNTWKFKHPDPNDFKRVIEKETGIELGWFMNEWIGTMHHVDYAIDNVSAQGDSTLVKLVNKGTMPMPSEVYVTYKDGSSEIFYFPLRVMRGAKTEFGGIKATLVSDWPWTNPVKEFTIPKPIDSIKLIRLNMSRRVPDIDLTNDSWTNP